MKRHKRKAKVNGRSRRRLHVKKQGGVRKLRRTKRQRRAGKPFIHQAAYNRGYDQGFDDAYNEGYNAGYAQGAEMAKKDNQLV